MFVGWDLYDTALARARVCGWEMYGKDRTS